MVAAAVRHDSFLQHTVLLGSHAKKECGPGMSRCRIPFAAGRHAGNVGPLRYEVIRRSGDACETYPPAGDHAAIRRGDLTERNPRSHDLFSTPAGFQWTLR
jgi:hypothetical protein